MLLGLFSFVFFGFGSAGYVRGSGGVEWFCVYLFFTSLRIGVAYCQIMLLVPAASDKSLPSQIKSLASQVASRTASLHTLMAKIARTIIGNRAASSVVPAAKTSSHANRSADKYPISPQHLYDSYVSEEDRQVEISKSNMEPTSKFGLESHIEVQEKSQDDQLKTRPLGSKF